MRSYEQIWKLVPNKIRRYPGGRELDRFRGIVPPEDDGCPEAWVGSDTRSLYAKGEDANEGCAECVSPDGKRQYLFEAIAADAEHLLGEKHIALSGRQVGVLAKLLDAQAQLNLQCHPSRAYAKAEYGSAFGKEECWYVLGLRDDTEEPPYVYMGFADEDAREKLAYGYDHRDRRLQESCCHKIPLHVGDLFFIGAGVPHAIGPGCFLLEVQEPSDVTVTPFYPSHLQLSPAELAQYRRRTLNCFDYTARTFEETMRHCAVQPRELRRGDWGIESLMIGPAQTDYFSFTRLQACRPVELTHTGFPQIAIVQSGSACLQCGSQRLWVRQADELFLPASVAPIVLAPQGDGATLLLCNPAGAVKEP